MYTILYVDDEPGLLEIAKLFLEQTQDFSVDTSISAEGLLGSGMTESYDAIISDYQMPGIDGIAFLKAVRRQNADIPFILFTGRGREEVVIEAINNGADFYIQKGGDPKAQFAELAHKIRQAVARRRAERLRTESEKRLLDIINFLPDATFAIDKSGIVIAWNRAMEEMTGTAAADVVGRGEYIHGRAFYGEARPMLIDLVLAPDEQFEQKKYLRPVRDSTTLTAETVLEKPGRLPVYLWGKASCLLDENGNLIGAIESIRDITGRKMAEEALKERESRLRSFVEATQEAVILIDEGGKVIEWNYGSERIFGISKEEAYGRYLWDLTFRILPCTIRLKDRGAASEHLVRTALRTGVLPSNEPTVVEAEHADGTRVFLRQAVFSIKTEKGFRFGVIAQDITEEQRAENAVRESEEKYRLVVENSHDSICIYRNGLLLFANRRTTDLIGYTCDEIIGMNIWDFVHPDDRARMQESGRRRISGEDSPPVFSGRLIKKTGDVRDCDLGDYVTSTTKTS